MCNSPTVVMIPLNLSEHICSQMNVFFLMKFSIIRLASTELFERYLTSAMLSAQINANIPLIWLEKHWQL